MRTVLVDFRKSRRHGLRHLGKVPQIVNLLGLPVRGFNQYLLANCALWSQNTIRTYANHLVHLASWGEANNLPVENLTQEHLAWFAHSLVSRTSRRLKASTCISALNVSNAFLKWTMGSIAEGSQPTANRLPARALVGGAISRLGILDEPLIEPVKFARLPDARGLAKVMSSVDVSGAHGKRNELMARLMFESGLRVAEIASLRVDSLPTSLYDDHASLASIIGKGNKRRFVSIAPSLLRELHGYIDLERALIFEKINSRIKPAEVFLGRLGESLSTGYIQQVFRKASAVLKKRITPHALRHTYGTYHYLVNRDLVLLQKLMGHASAETTQVYVGLTVLVDQSDKYHEFLQDLESD